MLNVHVREVGPYQMNTIVVWCNSTREAIWFDPGAEVEEMLRWIRENELHVTRLVNTHGHVDHIAENGIAKAALNVPLCIHSADSRKLSDPMLNLSAWTGMEVISPEADELLDEGSDLNCGEHELRAMHIPGHSPGSLVFYSPGILIAGDTLFLEGVGRTDFPDGNERDLYRAIREKIFALPDDTVIYPGHGPTTTVGNEKLHNPFIRP
jgi:hydroxyacylglutathione hydrolase